MKPGKYIPYFFFVFVLLLLHSISAFAHASPIEYEPAASSVLEDPPKDVMITFSERIEEKASSIIIYGPDGSIADNNDKTVDKIDTHRFSAGLQYVGVGTYTVSWSVVSADDGHFTKGAYVFSVGNASGTSSPQAASIAHVSSIPEAFALFLELLGMSLIMAFLIVLFYATFMKKSLGDLSAGKFLVSGALLIMLGNALYILIKSLTLMLLQEQAFSVSFSLFMQTIAGKAALYRLAIAFVVMILFLAKWKSKHENFKWLAWSGFLGMLLLIYFRTLSSHASAAKLFPVFTFIDHAIHLTSKLAWVGALFLLMVSMEKEQVQRLHLYRIIALAIGIAGISGGYIIWLDLKEFSLLLATQWGQRFIILIGISTILVAIHALFVYFQAKVSNAHRLSNIIIPLEVLLGCAMLFSTALLIITTPPLLHLDVFSKTQQIEDVQITLQEHRYDQGLFLIKANDPETKKPLAIKDVTILLQNKNAGIGPLPIKTMRRSEASFSFSKGALTLKGDWEVKVIVQRENAYDTTVSFSLQYPEGLFLEETKRTPLFSFAAILFSLVSVVVSSWLFMQRSHSQKGDQEQKYNWTLASFIVTAILLLSFAIHPLLKTPFQNACEKNGDSWHEMISVYEGRAVGTIAQPGCMFSSGLFQIPDFEEYMYLRTSVDADVSLVATPEQPSPKQKTKLTFFLKDANGQELPLTREHEKLLHIIIVNEDFGIFNHSHPESFSEQQLIERGIFEMNYSFPKPGKYLIGLDFSVKGTHQSNHFIVTAGKPEEEKYGHDFSRTKEFGDYTVYLYAPDNIKAGEQINLEYEIFKYKKPVTNLAPYLGAAMHLALIKEDQSVFLHEHAEVHRTHKTPLVQWVEKILLPSKKGKHSHSVASQPFFGPLTEAHVVFPEPGPYAVFGEFKHEGRIVTTLFFVRVGG